MTNPLALLVAVTLLVSPFAIAQELVMNIERDEAMVDHYPGPDGLIGNVDDVVSGANTTIQSSAPNSQGSYGHNSFFFGPAGAQDPALPTSFDAITFVNGTVTVDTAVAGSGGGPLITALEITSGTEPFPGHGAYTSRITAVNGGTYDPTTKAFMLDVDFAYTIFGAVSTEPGVILSGTAYYIEAADFGTPTGNDYVDNVVIPRAVARGASSALFMTGTGTLTNLGFPINATLVALDIGAVNINAGMNDAWVNADAEKQGFFFTVFPNFQLFFLSWFTFDSVIPDEGITVEFGARDHRWVTGLGPYSGDNAHIDVELTTGGIFNASDPQAEQFPGYGTITIVFISCNEALLTYNFPSVGLAGEMTLTRVLPDNVALCEILSEEA